MKFGYIKSSTGLEIVQESVSIKGSIDHTLASAVIVQRYRNVSYKGGFCDLVIDGGLDIVCYDISILRDNQEKINYLIEKQSSDNSKDMKDYQQIAENESSDAMLLNLGYIQPKDVFSIEIHCSFFAQLQSQKILLFNIPYTEDYLNQGKMSIDLNIKQLKKIENLTVKVDKENTQNESIQVDDKTMRLISRNITLSKKPEILISFKKVIESGVLLRKYKGQDNSYLAASIIPNIDPLMMKEELILVVDCSGSMSGKSIEYARDTMKLFLHSLPKECYFNIVRFGSSYEEFFDESVLFDEKNLNLALQLCDSLQADLGGTNLYAPLSYIMNKETKNGYVRQIFVLTDGFVEDEAATISMTTKNRKNSRIFSVGIGNSVSQSFIEELAKCSQGTSSFVNDPRKIMDSVMYQLTSSLSPAIVDANIFIDNISTFNIAPYPLPTCFTNKISHVFIKTSKKIHMKEYKSMLVSGVCGENEINQNINHYIQTKSIDIDKIYSYYNIRDLEDKLPTAKSTEIAYLKDSVIRLSMQSNIVSQFTKYTCFQNGKEVKIKKEYIENDIQDEKRNQQNINPNPFQDPTLDIDLYGDEYSDCDECNECFLSDFESDLQKNASFGSSKHASSRSIYRNRKRNTTPSYPSKRLDSHLSQRFAPPPSQGFAPPPSQGFAPQPSQGFAPQPSQGFAPPPSQGFAPQTSQGFAPQPSQRFARQPSQGFAPQPSQAFAPPSQGLAQPPSQVFAPQVQGQCQPTARQARYCKQLEQQAQGIQPQMAQKNQSLYTQKISIENKKTPKNIQVKKTVNKLPTQYSLYNLLMLQCFDGFWLELDIIEKMIKITFCPEIIPGDFQISDTDRPKLYATLLALAIMEKREKNNTDLCMISQQKAFGWLKSINADFDWISMVKQYANSI